MTGFTKSSYDNKKAKLNYLPQMYLRTGNSVHGKLDTFFAESLIVSKYITSICIKPCYDHIVGKGCHNPPASLPPPPFSKFPPFLEIQDVLTFYRPIRKTKVLNDSFNRFVYKFYPQSILILEEYLLKR